MCSLPPRASVAIGCSGLSTRTPSTTAMSPAVTLPSPSLSRRITFGLVSSIFNKTSFRFSTMSVTSSTTSGSVWNSCSAPSILTAVMAAPCSDDNSTRRRLLPSVVPKPRSSGSQLNLPYVWPSVSFSISSVFGLMRSRQFFAKTAGFVDAIASPPVRTIRKARLYTQPLGGEPAQPGHLCSGCLLRVELDDQLLADGHREVFTRRHP